MKYNMHRLESIVIMILWNSWLQCNEINYEQARIVTTKKNRLSHHISHCLGSLYLILHCTDVAELPGDDYTPGESVNYNSPYLYMNEWQMVSIFFVWCLTWNATEAQTVLRYLWHRLNESERCVEKDERMYGLGGLRLMDWWWWISICWNDWKSNRRWNSSRSYPERILWNKTVSNKSRLGNGEMQHQLRMEMIVDWAVWQK